MGLGACDGARTYGGGLNTYVLGESWKLGRAVSGMRRAVRTSKAACVEAPNFRRKVRSALYLVVNLHSKVVSIYDHLNNNHQLPPFCGMLSECTSGNIRSIHIRWLTVI